MILQGTVQGWGEGKADRKRDVKIIYQNGHDKGWVKPVERLNTEMNGEKRFSDHT